MDRSRFDEFLVLEHRSSGFAGLRDRTNARFKAGHYGKWIA
jgi:hypothetical protein